MFDERDVVSSYGIEQAVGGQHVKAKGHGFDGIADRHFLEKNVIEVGHGLIGIEAQIAGRADHLRIEIVGVDGGRALRLVATGPRHAAVLEALGG